MTVTASVAESVTIDRIETRAFAIPTDRPESDGTLTWDSTTIVIVFVEAGGKQGMGYSYTHAVVAEFIRAFLAERLTDHNAMDIDACWTTMTNAIRNLGDSGLGMMAVSAVDNALWDLKARLLNVPLVTLLGQVRPAIPVYGSGGFTSYTIEELQAQLEGWAGEGIKKVKMKVGREPDADPGRVHAARKAIGAGLQLFVDANGGYTRKQALALAGIFGREDVIWFEEPVYHRDLAGLRLLRDQVPAGMDISIGEYGFNPAYFREVLEAGAVDVLQADATRCGITGFLQASVLCGAYFLPLSSHCAPSLHAALGCACPPVRHLEYFHDHIRIERMLFDGVLDPRDGKLEPDRSRPGLGLELKEIDARRYEKK